VCVQRGPNGAMQLSHRPIAEMPGELRRVIQENK